jgi:hypothetical protein
MIQIAFRGTREVIHTLDVDVGRVDGFGCGLIMQMDRPS